MHTIALPILASARKVAEGETPVSLFEGDEVPVIDHGIIEVHGIVVPYRGHGVVYVKDHKPTLASWYDATTAQVVRGHTALWEYVIDALATRGNRFCVYKLKKKEVVRVEEVFSQRFSMDVRNASTAVTPTPVQTEKTYTEDVFSLVEERKFTGEVLFQSSDDPKVSARLLVENGKIVGAKLLCGVEEAYHGNSALSVLYNFRRGNATLIAKDGVYVPSSMVVDDEIDVEVDAEVEVSEEDVLALKELKNLKG